MKTTEEKFIATWCAATMSEPSGEMSNETTANNVTSKKIDLFVQAAFLTRDKINLYGKNEYKKINYKIRYWIWKSHCM